MKQITVGVGDCAWSKQPDETLVTYALGSCIAVVIRDPVANVAGLLHFMLPVSEPGHNADRPFMYADTGIPLLFQTAYRMGAQKQRIIVAAFGGAHVMDPDNAFNIGQRNYQAMCKIFRRAGVKARLEDVGGSLSRTVRLDVASGKIHLQRGEERNEFTQLMLSAEERSLGHTNA